MSDQQTPWSGLWLPLVTPFSDGALDEASLRRLVAHYAALPIDGLVLGATTGEGLTLEEQELAALVAIAAEERSRAGATLPILLGLSGSDTRRMARRLQATAAWPIAGYLVTCPYYTRPSQDGMVRHFQILAEAAAHPLLAYNIPYRTGVNLQNEAMLRLAQRGAIVGVKDCCADAAQSFALLRERPPGFAVLTGEDAHYYTALAQGADGAILASAHVETEAFARVLGRIRAGDQAAALAAWRDVCDLPPLLFAEPSPAPIKHWLWRAGLIASPELRLPMTPVSKDLGARIDREIRRRDALRAPAAA